VVISVSAVRVVVSFSLAAALVWVPASLAHAQAAPSAGQVAVVIPTVNLQRGAQQLAATPHAPVFWGDVVNTARLARARVALNDGSILNVGSASSLQIVSHDAAAQQTQIDLLYGRVRARAVHLTKPGASYQIRTRLGTAGVVGTDFFLALEGDTLRLIVFEGIVRFCNLAGVCVNVTAGKRSHIQGGMAPALPSLTPTALLSEAVNSTEMVPPGVAAKPSAPPSTNALGTISNSQATTVGGASVPPGGSIFDGDTVVVGPGGTAWLSLVCGAQAHIDQNSQVHLTRVNNTVQLQVLTGGVTLRSTTEGNPPAPSGSQQGVCTLKTPTRTVTLLPGQTVEGHAGPKTGKGKTKVILIGVGVVGVGVGIGVGVATSGGPGPQKPNAVSPVVP
jgi:FecR protein